ncbi:MAG: tetratricopeptide repeat protein [Deltaproteobacteria bacterium]|nr:tetratricopeptide repeat protein [Deltaproteobacteria bacterium]
MSEIKRLRLLVLLLTVSVTGLNYHAASSSSDEGVNRANTTLIENDEILKLNAEMRGMVDLYIKPINDEERRAQALYDLMFGSDKLAIRYDNSNTKTAIETIESRSGNCISLANAFIAMGRYADLDVGYLHVDVPDDWQRESDLYYQFRHISAAVRIPSNETLGIEFDWMGGMNSARTRLLTDEHGFSAFYSNRGVELLMQDDMDAAMAHMLRAIEIDPDNSNNWTNLGVAYRRLNQLDKAEHAYQQALRRNRSDLSALNNLAILYQMTGKTKDAEKYSKKLERYRRKNPYYMIELSKQEIEKGHYSKALRWAKRAIKKHSGEHEFYYVAAKAYAYLGDTDKAMLHLELAEEYAHQSLNRDRYSRKLELLRDMHKSEN